MLCSKESGQKWNVGLRCVGESYEEHETVADTHTAAEEKIIYFCLDVDDVV